MADSVDSNVKSPWEPLFSTSLKGAINRLNRDGAATSLDFAREILRKHAEYGNKTGGQTVKTINARRKSIKGLGVKEVNQWVGAVTELYDIEQVEELHGRLFIIGLAMLDERLLDVLNENGFLRLLTAELQEDLPVLLSDLGKRVANKLSLMAEAEQDDYLKNNDDNPLTDEDQDGLDRAKFARFVVRLLDKTSLKNGAFSIHLYAPWGAGKTSFMNFMKKFFLEDRTGGDDLPKWYTIDFNAWQNQSLPYPWWNFMNTIYGQLKGELPWKYRLREWFWRFKAQRMHQTLALLLICFLLFYFGDHSVKASAGWFDPFNKLLAALAGIWGIAISLSQNFVKGSQKAAQNYLESKDNPMADYKRKFNRLIGALSPSQIVIFIDDLDRCKSGYVVELLESIQTLFKESNVLFVIAADMTWLHASYEVEYDKIKGFIHVDGKTIGPLFIEKMFQLSIALPGVPDDIKERCWAGMLGMESVPAQVLSSRVAAGPAVNTDHTAFEKNHQERLEKLDKLASQANMQKTEHYLKPFSRYLDLNPRNMKRLLNNYLINKASALISHIDVNKRQLVLYTVLNIQWPVLAAFLVKNPECLTQRDELPDDIRDLMRQDEVIAVLEGRGFDDPLREETLVQCGLLFSCVGHHRFISKTGQRLPVDFKAEK